MGSGSCYQAASDRAGFIKSACESSLPAERPSFTAHTAGCSRGRCKSLSSRGSPRVGIELWLTVVLVKLVVSVSVSVVIFIVVVVVFIVFFIVVLFILVVVCQLPTM